MIPENFMHFLHVAPLAVILLLVVGAIGSKLAMKKTINTELLSAALLVLCSIGIVSGNHVHHHEAIDLLDPCFGYAATLIGVALKVARTKINARV